MGDLKKLFSDVVFILLVVEAILCLVGSVFLADARTKYYSHSSQHVFVMAVAVYLLITVAFIITYVSDGGDTNQVLFITLFIVGGCLNVAAGCLFIIDYVDTPEFFRTNIHIVLSITTLLCGILMFATIFLKAKK